MHVQDNATAADVVVVVYSTIIWVTEDKRKEYRGSRVDKIEMKREIEKRQRGKDWTVPVI